MEALKAHPPVDEAVARLGKDRGRLVAWLQALQAHFRYLPASALKRLSALTGVSEAEITGVATFYGQFRLHPAGDHIIRVCDGTACHVKGAEKTFDAFKKTLEIGEQENTDKDGLFTVEKVSCLGCCMLAVAVQVDDVIYGNVTPASVPDVLNDVLAGDLPVARDGFFSRLLRFGGSKNFGKAQVRMCTCSSCSAVSARETAAAVKAAIHRHGLPVEFAEVGCSGLSFDAPLMDVVFPDGRSFRYARVQPDDVERILLKLLNQGYAGTRAAVATRTLLMRLFTDAPKPVTRYPAEGRDHPGLRYSQCQCRIVTEGAAELQPLDFEGYRARGGWLGSPELDIVQELLDSGLRGRGGGGFPTGRKWAVVKASGGSPVIVCNADEGDPGAFMDRMLLESFPFRVLEGMLFAARTLSAKECLLYIRHEYPVALERVREAIAHLERNGLSAGVSFRIVEGAGAFVCGEETALIASLEGRRGTPRLRPPYPAVSGFEGHPTLVNNVETFAAIPWIVRHGATAFRKFGTPGTSGTKAFALAGKIPYGGLLEIPAGTTLSEIVIGIGGGDPEAVKAVQVGGPSGGCLPLSTHGNTGVDYEDLTAAGAMMGSGGLVVLDKDDCMVDIARYFLAFTQLESCGKCTTCRIGTRRMLEILEKLCAGKGTEADVAALERLAETIKTGSLCGLGKTAPNPVLSTLRHFREEYLAHTRGECPAKKCPALIRYEADPMKCIGCTLCAQKCPADAIPFAPFEKTRIDAEKCTRCDICRQICPQKAITRTTGNSNPTLGKSLNGLLGR